MSHLERLTREKTNMARSRFGMVSSDTPEKSGALVWSRHQQKPGWISRMNASKALGDPRLFSS